MTAYVETVLREVDIRRNAKYACERVVSAEHVGVRAPRGRWQKWPSAESQAATRRREMIMWHRQSPFRRVTLSVAVFAIAGLLAAPVSNSAAKSRAAKGGTVVFALRPATTPNYIFPLYTGAYFTIANLSQFQYLMYRPLYWIGKDGEPVLNEGLSVAEPPKWSANGRSVSITLKPYEWSDGETLDATDLMFWENMVTAEKDIWGNTITGEYPENVVSATVVNSRTVRFVLNKRYNETWFVDNELSTITPMPQAWDKTSLSAKAGSGGCAETISKCAAVYKFLAGQAANISDYATSSLWKVVDGPWRLVEFRASGYCVFEPNKMYSGPAKPRVAKFIEQPFTTDEAEFSAVLNGDVTVGYVPYNDIPDESRVKGAGYAIDPWPGWKTNVVTMNANNPTVGPLFRQLYIRQALEATVDQTAMIKTILDGLGTPTYGPVPTSVPNPYATASEHKPVYPYNIAYAKKRLLSHGWKLRSGVATCVNPGTGTGQCGSGIKRGTRLVAKVEYASGYQYITEEMEAWKSDAALAGIDLQISSAPTDTVLSMVHPCKLSPSCSAQMLTWAAGAIYFPDYYPSGDEYYASGSAANADSYDSPTADKLIEATLTAPPAKVNSTMAAYQKYLAAQVPCIYIPTAEYQITAVSKRLAGYSQESDSLISPEYWYFKKS